MKKKLTAVLLLLCLAMTVCLSACNNENRANELAEKRKTEFLEELYKDAEVTQERYNSALSLLNAAESYTYTVSLYLEDILNFDEVNRLMPKEQIPSDEKCWYKPEMTYTFTKVGSDTYYRAEFTDKTYERKEKKAFLYFFNEKLKISYNENDVQTVVYEGWNKAGVKTYKTDGAVVSDHSALVALINNLGYTYAMSDAEFDGDIAKFTINKLRDYDSFKKALFADKAKSFFGKEVGVYQTYSVAEVGSLVYVPYQDSALSNGYGEDMKFDWEKIQTVKITTSCVTEKKDKVLMFEHYNEVIGSYNFTEERIYDKQTVTNWRGDRISATKAVFEFDYGKKKSPVTLPAI